MEKKLKSRKRLNSRIFKRLFKLKDMLQDAKNPAVIRARYEHEFIDVSTKLLRQRDAFKSYIFLKLFSEDNKEFFSEHIIQAEVVLNLGDSGIIGDLYRSFPWTDSRFYFKAKTLEPAEGMLTTYSIIDGLLIKNKDVFQKDYPAICKYVIENGSDYECKTLAKVSEGETLSKLEDRFLQLNNNVFDIKDFALQKGVNEEKFLSKLIELGDIEDAVKVLRNKSDVILEKAKNNINTARIFVDICAKCGQKDLLKQLESNFVSKKISQKSKLSHNSKEEDKEFVSWHFSMTIVIYM